MPKIGSWFLKSKKDERWNCNGRGIICAGTMPSSCKDKIDSLKLSLGEPPDDLEISCWKD